MSCYEKCSKDMNFEQFAIIINNKLKHPENLQEELLDFLGCDRSYRIYTVSYTTSEEYFIFDSLFKNAETVQRTKACP